MVRITKFKLHRTISDIMQRGDLDSLTTKKIRLLCEQKYDVDLSDRKNEIDDIVLAFVKKKSKEMDDDGDNKQDKEKAKPKVQPKDQNNVNVKVVQPAAASSESSAEGSEDESCEDEESSCSGSESCSNSECSYSESSDNESKKEVPAKKNIANVTSTSKQHVAPAPTSKKAVASTSKQSMAAASTSKQSMAAASTSKQSIAVASTSKQFAANVTFNAVPAKKLMKNVTAPPKKRLTSQSMNAADDDVAAIAAATAAAAAAASVSPVIVPPKKKKIDVNLKSNIVVSAVTTTTTAAAPPPPPPPPLPAPVPSRRSIAANKTEMDDAAYARQLQAEEWNFRRGTINKLLRSIPQKKTKKNEQTKKKKACPFMKKCLLSRALAEVLGTNEMSRPDIVQKMWSVVKERNLFDPSNKQFVLCDEQLASIFGKKRIRLIGMMKYLKQHIKDVN